MKVSQPQSKIKIFKSARESPFRGGILDGDSYEVGDQATEKLVDKQLSNDKSAAQAQAVD